jgi:proteasome beta subunit
VVDLALRALWTAADEDSATGGPDALRGIWPVVATITADGYQRVPDAELAERFTAIVDADQANRGTAAPAGGEI